MEFIQKSELFPIRDKYTGNEAFDQTLRSIRSGKDLLLTLGRYVYFNVPFGAGVANLAGEIAAREDLFRIFLMQSP